MRARARVQTIVFPAGHNTVVHDLETRTQKFLNTEKTEEITAMTISPSRKVRLPRRTAPELWHRRDSSGGHY